MKNFKLFGIIVMVAVIGFSMASCFPDDEYEEETHAEFDSALVGNWIKDGSTNPTITISFSNESEVEFGGFYWYCRTKNGNTYTVEYNNGPATFTAVVGSDGKLTVSGMQIADSSFNPNDYNGTYTKQ